MIVQDIATKQDIEDVLIKLNELKESLTKPDTQTLPQLYNQKEAAKILAISVKTLRNKSRTGEIPSILLCSGIYRYSSDVLNSIIHRGQPFKYNKGL